MMKRKLLIKADPWDAILNSPEFKQLMSNTQETKEKVILELIKEYDEKKTTH